MLRLKGLGLTGIHSQREARRSLGKRSFKKMRAEHHRLPSTISVDKNAVYSEAFATKGEGRRSVKTLFEAPLGGLKITTA